MNLSNSKIEKHLNISRVNAKQLKCIFSPLFDRSQVKYFGYNRFFRDQTWLGIYSEPAWVEKSLRAGEMPLFLDAQGVFIEPGVYFFRDIKDIFKTKILADYVEQFFAGVDDEEAQRILQNAYLIVRKGNVYDETFFFSLAGDTALARAYFYQISPELKRFCQYFLHKAKALIEEADQSRVAFYPPPRGAELFPGLYERKHDLSQEDAWFDNKKFCVGTAFGDVFLSHQELNCLRLISGGCTHNEIGEHLAIQNRTVESYIQNLKNKLMVSSRAELATIYRNFSIIDHLSLPASVKALSFAES